MIPCYFCPGSPPPFARLLGPGLAWPPPSFGRGSWPLLGGGRHSDVTPCTTLTCSPYNLLRCPTGDRFDGAAAATATTTTTALPPCCPYETPT